MYLALYINYYCLDVDNTSIGMAATMVLEFKEILMVVSHLVINGAAGFLASYYFVRKIYGALEI